MTEYKCTYCQGKIPNVRFRCSECKDFQLCLECFTCGAEIGKHKYEHSYEILDDGFKPLFTTEDSCTWTARQELALIEGIEQYGLGNWAAISCKAGNKSEQDVKDHFSSHYVSGTIGLRTRLKQRKYRVTDHTGPVEGPLSPSITAPLPPVNLTKAEALELGFLPLRDDFEREWDNEAEQVLSTAMVQHNDEEIDIQYKLSLVSMYRLRLQERARRKKVARDYSLVNNYTGLFKKGQSGAKKRSVREYREFTDNMKRLARFMNQRELDGLFHSLQREKQVKARIKELMKCRRNGIETIQGSEEFIRESARREKNRENRKNSGKPSTPNPAPPTPSATALTPEIELPQRRSQALEITGTPINNKRSTAMPAADPPPCTREPRCHRQNGQRDVLAEHTQVKRHNGESNLSDKERRLCKKIGMKATSYITLKTCILKDYLKRQHDTPVKLRFPSGFDKTHRRTILNFLESSGWIQLEN